MNFTARITAALAATTLFLSPSADAACGDGILDPGEQCDDSGLDSGDGCTATCLVEACVPGLGPAAAFNVFVLEDYAGGVDVAGRVAAGQDVLMEGFRTGYEIGAGPVLIAGRDLILDFGVVHGDALYGNAYTTTNDFAVNFLGGAPILSPGIDQDFLVAEAGFFGTSAYLATLPTTGTTRTNRYDNVALIGRNADLNVFNVTAQELDMATWMGILAPDTSTVVINITGDPAFLGGFDIQFFGGAAARNVLFNFVDAQTLTLDAIDVEGSILAPFADVFFDNGQMHGTLIANSLTGGGEFYRPGGRFVANWICP